MFSKNRSQTSVENMSGTQCVIMPTSDSVTCYYSWNNSRFGRKWTDWIDKQWEGSRKPSGVRRQSASCPQPKYTSSNKYGGESWLMRCANLTARPKTSLTSCDPLHFSREVSSWLSQTMKRSCFLSDIKIGANRRNHLCVLSGTLHIGGYLLWRSDGSFEFIPLSKFAKSYKQYVDPATAFLMGSCLPTLWWVSTGRIILSLSTEPCLSMPAVSILISLDLFNKATAIHFAQLPGVSSFPFSWSI